MPGKIDIGRRVESDLAFAPQHQPPILTYPLGRGCGVVGTGCVGREADQAENARIERAMSDSGQRERALQFNRDARRPVELARLGQRPHEGARDAHWPDRVRGGRTDPDPEDVEHR